MKTHETNTYTVFNGTTRLFRGPLSDVVLKIKKQLGSSDHSSVLIFSDTTGKTMDFNFHGSEKDVLKRLEVYSAAADDSKEAAGGPGRPKLGVVSREISLLPRHWEWLATQPGGASATLRTLVEEARKKSTTSLKQLQEVAYRVMSVLAGDLPHYEEALRALYKRDHKKFLSSIQTWPADVKTHLVEMTEAVFAGDL